MGRLSYTQKENMGIAYDSIAKKAQEAKSQKMVDEKIKALDKRYMSIVSIIYNELNKRNGCSDKLDTSEFDSRVDEIIQTILKNELFKRFRNDNPIDIRNAVKRRINSCKTTKKDKDQISINE